MGTKQVGQLELTSNVLTSLPNDVLLSNDISIRRNSDYLEITSKDKVVGNVDCTDFLKDGMLSSVELCGSHLVFKFND